ncbi:metal ABC transporter solute-binding protein, Zn/Mn family [Virgibacillus kekensis]|uniref:Metal ABC transporter solute-binding protein, Zn/Mn family n=1 Tax=Virgibacillus kekensis TaxID=202261 RepID=A0ABV9DIM6_9BACI
MNKYLVIMFIICGFIISGCTSSPNTQKNNQFTVYTSLYPIQYAVERIAGKTVETKSVYPPGVDAHTYEPAAKEITAIAEGDAFIYLGAGMEAFAETTAQALKSQDVRLIELGKHDELFHNEEIHDSHEETEAEHHGHDHGDVNPHIWLDPLRMIEMASLIKEELISMRPENKQFYEQNFSTLKNDLLALDQQFIETLKPKNDKRILVSHAAYSYWEDRYGIEQIAISGISSSNEPSQKDLTRIIEAAKRYNMNYLILEQNSSDRVTEIIRQEIDARALYIHNLSVLTEEDIRDDENYLSLMRHNLSVLDTATEQEGTANE